MLGFHGISVAPISALESGISGPAISGSIVVVSNLENIQRKTKMVGY